MTALAEQLNVIMARFPGFETMSYVQQSEKLSSIVFLLYDMYPQVYPNTSYKNMQTLRERVLTTLGMTLKPTIVKPYRKIAVLLTTLERDAVLVHQGFDGLDIPMGSLDNGEDAVHAASRELFEETGIILDLQHAQFTVVQLYSNYCFVFWKPLKYLRKIYSQCCALSDKEASNHYLMPLNELASPKMQKRWHAVGKDLIKFVHSCHQDYEAVMDDLFA